jgi:hypothetical protein
MSKSSWIRVPIWPTDALRLAHIVHGPHNREFHALWNQLRDEHEELVMKGYTGEGFLSEGKRLGGRRMPIHEARRQARAAAERRRVLSAGSGQRLGGAPVLRGTDMRRVIADAAQRRIDVTEGCASGAENSNELAEEASRNGFRTKAEEDDANEQAIMQAYIDLIEQEERERYGPSYIPPCQGNPAGPRPTLSPPVPESTRPTAPPQPQESIGLMSDNSLYEVPWTCPTCTLENPANFLCCDACATERPRPSNTRSVSGPATISSSSGTQNRNKRRLSHSAGQTTFKNRTRAVESLAALERNAPKRSIGWICPFCETFMETEWWSCSNCGTVKPSS